MKRMFFSNFYSVANMPKVKLWTDRDVFRIRNYPELARKTAQGRNERCVCGSGRKYKHCCGK